jgi:hypothetical protein
VGDLALQIPKLRAGSFLPSILEPRRRVDQALYAVIMEAYIGGVSTRKVDALVASPGRSWCRWKRIGPGGSPGCCGVSCSFPPSMCFSPLYRLRSSTPSKPRCPLDGSLAPAGHPCPALVVGGTREALPPALAAINDPAATIFVSAATGWDLATKGRPPRRWLQAGPPGSVRSAASGPG